MTKPTEITNEITRRQWLLRLGEVGMLAGVSGLVPDVLGAVIEDQERVLSLPPGLYDPSADAMVHALGHHGLVIPPPGSETEYAIRSSSPFQPHFFSHEEFGVVVRITEIILGKMDTTTLSEVTRWIDLWFGSAERVRNAALGLDPMHRALAAAYYGEEEVRELETIEHPTVARKGIAALESACAQKYSKKFSAIEINEQTELLHSISTLGANNPLHKFFETVRNEAIRGYYTSAAGLRELDYKGNAYNPECPGCEINTEKSGIHHPERGQG